MKRIRRILAKVGVRGTIEFLLHPLLVPLFSALAWVRSLWASRVLLKGRWSGYNGFSAKIGLSRFFYKILWLNIDLYGKTAKSPLVGFGEYSLSRWFHVTLWSLYIYSHAGAVTTLCGTLAWVFSHFVWVSSTPWTWVTLVTITLGLSFTAYNMAFHRQNYNILGWMWMPLTLYGVFSDQLLLAALALFAGSFASITMVVCTVSLVLVLSIFTGDPKTVIILFPALIKMTTHVLPMLKDGDVKRGFNYTAKLIGLTKKNVKYKRQSMGFDVHNIYISILYFLGCSIIWYVSKEFPVLPFSASILFIINQRIRRFADEQSMYLVFVSCFASRMMLIPWSWGALAAFILVANPFPFLLGLSNLKKQRLLTWIPKKTPYDHTSLLDGLKNFLSSVPASKRVLMAFDDPHDRYESVFDGFRILRDTVAYVANKQCIHLFPDWFAVAETNYEGSPGFWGRSREKVLENMKQWGAEYAIIYQESGTTLDASWQDEFEVLSTFDWGEWSNELCGEEPWSSEITPKWWLLKRNSF